MKLVKTKYSDEDRTCLFYSYEQNIVHSLWEYSNAYRQDSIVWKLLFLYMNPCIQKQYFNILGIHRAEKSDKIVSKLKQNFIRNGAKYFY